MTKYPAKYPPGVNLRKNFSGAYPLTYVGYICDVSRHDKTSPRSGEAMRLAVRTQYKKEAPLSLSIH